MSPDELVLVLAPDTQLGPVVAAAVELSRRLGVRLRAIYVEDLRLVALEGHAGVRRLGATELGVGAELRAHAGAAREALGRLARGLAWQLAVVQGLPDLVAVEAAGQGALLAVPRHVQSALGSQRMAPSSAAWTGAGSVALVGNGLDGPVVAVVAAPGEGPALRLARRLAGPRRTVEIRDLQGIGQDREVGILVIDGGLGGDPALRALADRWQGTVVLAR